VIRLCTREDRDGICAIINDAARAYQNVIAEDRWKQPYMPMEELIHEIEAGVRFWGHEQDGELDGVMGIQTVDDVTLIRHAYVRPSAQRRGIGGQLLSRLRDEIDGVTLVGTWADATWAIRFYQRHGFRLVDTATKNALLKTYWSIPERQIEESVVLTNAPLT
jgi:GNAT superfamily N-acetyltransferase